jgi:LPS sulfotransferase NodH
MVADEPALPKTDAVLLLHGFRTGSNYVASILTANGFGAPTERFNGNWQQSVRNLGPAEMRQNAIERIRRSKRRGIFASKLPLRDLMWLARAIGDVADPIGSVSRHFRRSAVVIIERRDVFLQSVSFWRAAATGEWLRHSSAKQTPPAPDYDQAKIAKAYQNLCRMEYLWRELVARSGIEPIRVVYEDFVSEPQHLLQMMHAVADKIDPGGTAIKRDFTLQSDVVGQRDELSYAYRDKFVAGMLAGFTSQYDSGAPE